MPKIDEHKLAYQIGLATGKLAAILLKYSKHFKDHPMGEKLFEELIQVETILHHIRPLFNEQEVKKNDYGSAL